MKMLKERRGGGGRGNIRAFFCFWDSQFLIDPDTVSHVEHPPAQFIKHFLGINSIALGSTVTEKDNRGICLFLAGRKQDLPSPLIGIIESISEPGLLAETLSRF